MRPGSVPFPCWPHRSPRWRLCFPGYVRWLDWWLSTCGDFRENLPVEVRADFERLILSGSRALEFLGCTALGNLVLSRRDSLLADICSTVPAEEVARLRYSPLPETVFLFRSPLLDSALTKMRRAANDALVQRTLHPPGFLGSLRLLEGRLGRRLLVLRRRAPLVPVLLRSSLRLLPLLASLARRGRAARVRLPFPLPPEAPAALEEKVKEPERSRPIESRGLPGSALEAVVGDRNGVLGRDRSPGRLPCSLHGLSSPFLHHGVVSDVPGRLSSGSSLVARGQGDACQRSLRNRLRSGSWLLQSSFPGGEGGWRPVIDLSPE